MFPLLSRRGLGAAAVANLLPGAAKLRAGEKPRAGEKLRAAVLGTGHAHAAGKIIALRRMDGVELVGVCEPGLLRRPQGAAFSGLRWMSEEELLSDSSIRLVAVESTMTENLAHAEKAIAAGKFVHLDKAPGTDWKRLEHLLMDARRKGLTVQMGYQWRYHPVLRAAVEAARNGWLGEIYMVRATINQALTPEQRAPLAAFKGGMMFELGCHLIDRIVDLLGEPKRVTALCRHHSPIPDDLEDNTIALLEFDKAMAEVYVAAQQPNGNDYRTFEVLGTNGTFVARPFSPYRGYTDLRTAAGPYPKGRRDISLPPDSQPVFTPDFEDLAAVMRGTKRSSYSVEHDLAVQKVLLSACGYAV